MSTFLAAYVMHVICFHSMTMIDLELCFVFHDSSALPVHNDINREGRKCQNIPQLSSNLAPVKRFKKKERCCYQPTESKWDPFLFKMLTGCPSWLGNLLPRDRNFDKSFSSANSAVAKFSN